MRNNKFLLFVFAILAFLGLGIGYAALTDTLTLNGTVGGQGVLNTDVESPDKNVFSFDWVENSYAVEINQKGERNNDITVTKEFQDDKLTITIKNFAIKDESVKITITAVNNSDYFLVPTMGGDSAYQTKSSIEYYFMSTDPDYFGQPLAKGETETFTLYFKNTITWVDEPQADVSFTFTLTGTAVDPAVNPNA